MKKLVCLLLFFVGCLTAIMNCTELKDNTLVPVYKEEVASGIEYTRFESGTPCVVYVVKFDPKLVKTTLEPAVGQREQVSSIAKRARACVAVNGANYRRGGRYNGNRLNVMKSYGVLYDDPQLYRGTVGWSESWWHMDYVLISWELIIGEKSYSVDRLNQPRKKGESILYTSTVDPGVVKTSCGIDLIIKNGYVMDIVESGGSLVPENGFIYQFDGDLASLDDVVIDMPVSISHAVEPRNKQNFHVWNTDNFLLGGAGFILDKGKILHDEVYAEFSMGERLFLSVDEYIADFHPREEQEHLIDKDHPRTALGMDNYGFQYLVVVDGRSDLSKGMTLPSLAHFMFDKLGCKQALNIGGGGCSTLVINGKVINKPSQGAERPVSEALCLRVSLAD